MKLKHLFLAALAIGTFASCSNDGDGLDTPVYKDIDANLSISVTPKITISKASSVEDDNKENGSTGEQFIQTLTAFVFEAEGEGNFVTKVTSTSDGTTSLNKIENIIVKVKAEEAGDISTSTFKVILVANVKDIPDPKNLADFKNSHFEGISNYTFNGVNGKTQSQYLPMGSAEVEVYNLVAGTAYDNWIKASDRTPVYVDNIENKKLEIFGDKVSGVTNDVYSPDANDENKIVLTRYVARVQLESLDADFKENLKGASFELINVALANVSNASKFVADANTGYEYVIGQGNNGAYADNAFFRGYPKSIDRADYYLALGQYANQDLAKEYTGITIDNARSANFKDATSGKSNGNNEMAQFYAFEFDGYQIAKDADSQLAEEVNTLLIITGKIKDVSGVNPNELRSFRIPIKHDNDTKAVKRNYIYKVNATLTGTGTPNPDETLLNAFMSFSIKV